MYFQVYAFLFWMTLIDLVSLTDSGWALMAAPALDDRDDWRECEENVGLLHLIIILNYN